VPASTASRPIAPPASVLAQRAARRRTRHGIERLAFAVERLAGLAGLDPGAARHRAGIEGLAAERTTGIGPGAAHGASRASRPIAGLDAGAARHRAGIERLAPRPVVRRIGIDEGACGWQVYPQ
jgi:hypothetical protein